MVENTTTITDGIVRMTNVEGASRRVIVIPQERKPLMEQKLKEPLRNPEEGRSWTFMFYERVTELLALAGSGVLTFDGFLDARETDAMIEATGKGRLWLTRSVRDGWFAL
jgi:hypothetical protein